MQTFTIIVWCIVVLLPCIVLILLPYSAVCPGEISVWRTTSVSRRSLRVFHHVVHFLGPEGAFRRVSWHGTIQCVFWTSRRV